MPCSFCARQALCVRATPRTREPGRMPSRPAVRESPSWAEPRGEIGPCSTHSCPLAKSSKRLSIPAAACAMLFMQPLRRLRPALGPVPTCYRGEAGRATWVPAPWDTRIPEPRRSRSGSARCLRLAPGAAAADGSPFALTSRVLSSGYSPTLSRLALSGSCKSACPMCGRRRGTQSRREGVDMCD
jgi:hypothetical protein